MPENDVTVAVTLNAPQQPKEYNLSATVDPAEGGTVTFSKTKAKAGEEVTIKLTLNGGYTLKGISCPVDMIPLNFIVDEWKIVMPENDVTVAVTLNAPAVVTHTVTVAADPAEGGTVTGDGSFDHGSSVTVKAEPNTDYWFEGWYEGENYLSADEEYTIASLEKDMALTARFAKDCTVTLNMNGGTILDSNDEPVGSISLELYTGYTQKIPTVEWMTDAIEDGSWITAPAGSEYIGAEITDANGTKTYQPGEEYTVISDATIKVLWKSTVTPPTKHTVTVYSGNADKSAAEAGETVTLTADAPPSGKEFDKWVVNAGGISLADETASTTTFTMPAANVEVTATYKDSTVTPPGPTTYTVTVNGGTADKSAAAANETVTLTADAPPTGKEFDKWVVNAGGISLADETASTTTFTMPATNVEVTATYKDSTVTPPGPTTYTVTVNGGTADKSAAAANETVTLTADAPPTGKEFDKWVVNAGGISLADETASTTTFTMPATNVEVTATYKDSTVTPPGPTTYTVTVNGGTADKSAAAANETVTLTADAPPTGKEFDKWVVNAGGISLANENASTTTFTMPATDVEVTATYKDSSVTPPGPTTYTMTFKDGDTVLSTQTVESGQKATKPADPTKDGYTFGGWYADATFSAAFDFDTAIAADTTIYAKFTANSVTPPVTTSTISYNLNGGTLNGKTGTVTLSVENGTTITLPAPTREGYTFDYWEGSRYNAGDSYTVNGDHTFTAQWKKNSTTPGTGDPGKTSPQTGDESNLALWFTMMIASLIAMVLVLLGIRKRKPQEGDR